MTIDRGRGNFTGGAGTATSGTRSTLRLTVSPATLTVGDIGTGTDLTTVISGNIGDPSAGAGEQRLFRIQNEGNSIPNTLQFNVGNQADGLNLIDGLVIGAALEPSIESATKISSTVMEVTFSETGPLVGTSSASLMVGSSVSATATAGFSDQVNGLAASFVEATYVNNGPFTNVIPSKDPLQGMLRQIDEMLEYLRGVRDATTPTTLAGLRTRAGTFKTSNDAAFPASVDGVVRAAAALGKIPIRGRKNLAGLSGRGRRLKSSYTDEIGNDSIRQEILRKLDILSDFADIILADASIVGIRTSLGNLDLDVNLTAMDAIRAAGPVNVAYTDTVVNGSSDQGILRKLDIFVDIFNGFAGLTAANGLLIGSYRTIVNANDITRLNLSS